MRCLVVLLSTLWVITDACPRIISKAEWGALPGRCHASFIPQRNYVIIHHTVTPPCYTQAACCTQLKNMQRFQMKKWCDLGYSFMIGEDGNVYEAQGWHRHGIHAPKYNRNSLGLAFIGNFQEQVPNPAAINAAQNLIKCAIEKKVLIPFYTLKAHRNVYSTACPGNALYNIIRFWDRFKAQS
uniref:Peptidoglycan-recognition protein n=1 Tax=Geotrypetes seraphini TaxID=260995 RepID=A0A6P8S8I1_GEOSA|nr:peptidoglycan-recognition protein SC2-like [Geotrypetes seraphini]